MKSDQIKNSIQRGQKKSKRKEELQVDKMKIDIGKIPHESYELMMICLPDRGSNETRHHRVM